MRKKTDTKNDIQKKALAVHKKLQGKIAITPKGAIRDMHDLSLYYTPGVGAVSSHVAKHPKDADIYTIRRNTVAVVSDGSAVLGLGNIGALGALPVMEGKAMIFKAMADIDAFPIVLDTQDTEEIIQTVKNIAPVFGGINLEDIAAPRCFEIEARLKKELKIPVMHDDQHGTAIVVLAGLINAFKVVGKDIKKSAVTIVGAGAAGFATAMLLKRYGVREVIVLDSKGAIHAKRKDVKGYKAELAKRTNKKCIDGGVREALAVSDAVVGVSGPNLITADDIAVMHENPIVFALANPVPEILPEEAKRGGAMVIATGRSDFPNQINNALVFPGIFRGALNAGVRDITDAMKLKAAEALALLVKKPTTEKIIPGIFDRGVVPTIARAIAQKK